MFPEAPSTGMMVVIVTQKTQNDMTSWCAEVETEREEMLDKVNVDDAQGLDWFSEAAAVLICLVHKKKKKIMIQ